MTVSRFISFLAFVAASIVALNPPALAASGYSFQGLGDLPGGEFSSWAHGLSADGSTVVGESVVGDRSQAFRWTRAGGIQSLGAYPGGDDYSIAWDVSADGSVVAGQARVGAPWLPFRWTAETGMIALESLDPSPGGEARSISDDGTVITGQSFSWRGLEPAVWSGDDPPVGLGHSPIGQSNGYANGISADGTAVVGSIQAGQQFQAFRWTAETGHISLGNLDQEPSSSHAYAVSADGRVVVGGIGGMLASEAFRWTAETGMIALGKLLPTSWTEAFGVSADGSVIVGRSDGAFIWTEQSGMQDLRLVLMAAGVTEVEDWHFYGAVAVSADGRTITGTGFSPQGKREAWIATIPEPSTGLLAGLGLLIALGVSYLRPSRA